MVGKEYPVSGMIHSCQGSIFIAQASLLRITTYCIYLMSGKWACGCST
ncbi:hypothetical protein MPTK2_1g13090 [Marchantia polymorpha subsp. ruderalis]